MSFSIKSATDFSSFKINSKLDRYLSNTFNSPLPAEQNKVLRVEIKNEDEENIENLFDFN